MRRLVPLLFAAAVATAPAVSAKDVLHLYNWNNYIAPETVKRFEASCKCELKQTYYSDNEEMLAKLAAGAKGYDIVVPTGNALESLIKQKKLAPMDKAKLPNLKNINPAYLDTAFDRKNQHSVPYAYTITMLGYNDEKMKELGITVDSWAVIFDPKVMEKLKGRITVLDSSSELMAAALRYLGHSINETDEKKLRQAADLIKKAKPYWAAFNASSYIKELTVGNIWVAHGYSNDIFQANLDAQAAGRKFHIVHALPKEGAVLAVDSMAILANAPRPDLAYKFIDFMLDGKNSAELSNLIGSGNPNNDALQHIKADVRSNKAVFPDQAVLAKLEQQKDFAAKDRRFRSRLWTEVKVK
jgi:spermidine/putrescine transport system substrate-binding protein